MEWSRSCGALLVGLAMIAAGCNKPAGTNAQGDATDVSSTQSGQTAQGADAPSAQPAKTSTPETAVGQFLEAVRTGNDRVAEGMFTDVARDRIKELNIQVAPRGSDTAKFEVGKAEFLADDGARVPCKWTDSDKEGNSRTDEITWMLRKEPQGWRVAGMAAVIFEGENPLLLDFENPKETLQKLDKLREEVARRTTPQQGNQARQPENSGDPLRR
jgi:hypothetical protein